jgi:hypothetical protein
MLCKGITKYGRPCKKKTKNKYCPQHNYGSQYTPRNIGYFATIPEELFLHEIIPHLSFKDKIRLSQTSKDINKLFTDNLRQAISMRNIIWQTFLRDIEILKTTIPPQIFSYVYICYSFPWCNICFTYSNLSDKYTFEIDIDQYIIIKSTTKTLDNSVTYLQQLLNNIFFDKLEKKKELREYSFTPQTIIKCSTNVSAIYDKYVNLQYPPIFDKVTRLVSQVSFFSNPLVNF